MAVKTQFTKYELEEILADYRLGKYQEHKDFEQGDDQTNILLITTKGKFAFRYYEKRSLDYVRFEIDLLEYLAKHNYPSPVPFKNSRGEAVSLYNDKPFAIFSFLEGEHNENYDNYKQVAKAVANLHLITEGYKPLHHEIRNPFSPSTCLEDAVKNARKIESKQESTTRLEWLKSELSIIDLPDNLPTGACRGDTNPSNFLYKNGKLSAVLDFDQASYSCLVYDVVNMIGWWTWPDKGQLDFAGARELIEEYEKIRVLSAEEKDYLYDALKMLNISGIGWAIHDDEEYYDSKRKIEYLNSLGREEFRKKLF